MFVVDLAILGVLALTGLIGLFRGFFREVLSLVSWVLALWVAFNFSDRLVVLFEPYLDESFMRYAASFASLFLVTLLLVSIGSSLVHRLFWETGLTGVDRVLGGLLGVVIGAVLVAAVIVVAEVIGLTEVPWWQQARLPRYFQPLVELMYDLLPLLRELLPPGFRASVFGEQPA